MSKQDHNQNPQNSENPIGECSLHPILTLPEEVPASILVVKSLLALLAIIMAVLFVSFLPAEYHYEFHGIHQPVPSKAALDSDFSVSIPETDIPQALAGFREPFDYTTPVPESTAHPISYFDDTVFIGDSRTAGLIMYTKMSPINFSATGINVKTAMLNKYVRFPDENGTPKNHTLIEALQIRRDEYKAIYISMGLNELGWEKDAFASYYRTMIETIRANVDVPIYIQLIMPVTTESSQTTKYGITNEKAILFNEELRKIAAEMKLLLLDPTDLLTLEDGTLDPKVTYDGVHLNPGQYQTMVDFYCTHVVDFEKYNNILPEEPAPTDEVSSNEQDAAS